MQTVDSQTMLRKIKWFSLLVLLAVGVVGYAHPSASLHHKDLDLFLGGYKGTGLGDVAYSISDSIDNELGAWFRQKYGSIPGNHRLFSHGYTLGEAIPRETLDAIAKAYGEGAVKDVIRQQQEIAGKYLKRLMDVTGLPRTQSRALLRQFSNGHLLGDLMKDNRLVSLVKDFDSICESEIRIMDDLFGKANAKYAEKIIKEIKALKKSALPVAEKAERLTQLFGKFKVDAALNKAYGNVFKKAAHPLAYNVDQAIARNAKLLERMEKFITGKTVARSKDIQLLRQFHKELKLPNSALKQGIGNNPTKLYSPTKLAKMNGVSSTKQTVGILKQVTMKNGSKGVALIVPVGKVAMKAGVTAGVMTFVISEGITTYQFIAGDISEEDFYWESTKNITEAVLVGAATFVAVTLGATPYGWVVLAVGVTTYIVCDISFRVLRHWVNGPGFDLEDILVGVPPEIKNRLTAMDYTDKRTFNTLLEYQGGESPLIYRGRGESPFEPLKGESPLELQMNRRGTFDFND